MKGLVIALGKKPPESSKGDEGGDSDSYDTLATGMMRAFKAGDTKELASLLRGCGFMGGGEDEDYD